MNPGSNFPSFGLAMAVVFTCLMVSSLFGQAATSSINGTVQDQTSAVIPGADVVISNASKGIERKLQTNGAGLFTAPTLVPAAGYSMTVTKTGFSKYEVNNITLQVGQSPGREQGEAEDAGEGEG